MHNTSNMSLPPVLLPIFFPRLTVFYKSQNSATPSLTTERVLEATSSTRDENSALNENYSRTREASVQPSLLTKKITGVLGRSDLVMIVKQQLVKHQNFAGYSQGTLEIITVH